MAKFDHEQTIKVDVSHAEPLPHDGWQSRAVIMGGSLIVVTIFGATIVVATDTVDRFMQIAPWLTSSIATYLGIALGSTTLKGLAEAYRRR